MDIAIGRTAGFITAPLVVQIRAVSGGVPSGPALAGASIPAANVPEAFFPSAFYSVPFASPAPVAAGVQYAIVVSSLSCGLGNCYEWAAGPVGDSYPAGKGLGSQDFGAKTFELVDAMDNRALGEHNSTHRELKPRGSSR